MFTAYITTCFFMSLILFTFSPIEDAFGTEHEITITIDLQNHHIGDKYILEIRPSEPEDTKYEKQFHLDRVPKEATLSLIARHVDPDVQSSPAVVIINNKIIDYLNNHVQIETIDEEMIELQVPVSTLKKGNNELIISVDKELLSKYGDTYFQENIDDIWFRSITLTVSYDAINAEIIGDTLTYVAPIFVIGGATIAIIKFVKGKKKSE